jgi:hypothetical protein
MAAAPPKVRAWLVTASIEPGAGAGPGDAGGADHQRPRAGLVGKAHPQRGAAGAEPHELADGGAGQLRADGEARAGAPAADPGLLRPRGTGNAADRMASRQAVASRNRLIPRFPITRPSPTAPAVSARPILRGGGRHRQSGAVGRQRASRPIVVAGVAVLHALHPFGRSAIAPQRRHLVRCILALGQLSPAGRRAGRSHAGSSGVMPIGPV